jgi:hypothetical protein
MKKTFSWLIWKIFFERQSPFKKRQCWFCFPALKWLNKINIENFRVLEFGGGGSTLYFSDKNCIVQTIETNNFFKNKIRDNLRKDNVEFVKKPKGIYDLILIDSSNNRVKEFELAKRHIKKNGIIIFDNIDRYSLIREQMNFVFKGWALDYAGITETGVFINEA